MRPEGLLSRELTIQGVYFSGAYFKLAKWFLRVYYPEGLLAKTAYFSGNTVCDIVEAL